MGPLWQGWRGAQAFVTEDLIELRLYYLGAGWGLFVGLGIAAVTWAAWTYLSTLPAVVIGALAWFVGAGLLYRPATAESEADNEPVLIDVEQ